MSEPRLPDLTRSFERHLRAENKSDRTIETYLEAVRLLETFLAGRNVRLADADRAHIEAFLADLLARWKPATAANRYRSLKVFYAWLEQEGEIAADYLEGLLDIADLDGDIDMDVEGDRASVSIVGGDLKQLVGRDGQVLEAVQELTRLAVLRVTGERSRLMLDIGGFRAARREELTILGRKSAQEAKDGGKPVRLAPMTPFERKIVHDAVAAAGLRSESEGEEPDRYVVVFPE